MIETIDPATGEVLERIEAMSPQRVEAKLAAAARAFKGWRATSFDVRADLLQRVAARFRDERERLAATAVREMGKPLVQARAEVDKCAWALDYFAEHGEAMLAPQPAESTGTRSYVAFRPLGTLLAIMPWNFPFWQVIRAAAPAMMAGNVLLLKHATSTTRCALEIERVFIEAGAADGCFGTLLVPGKEVGKIVADRRVAAVTLTGSEGAGISVARAAGEELKKCVLELGGSDAFVVLADADLEAAAAKAVTARFQNNGESCIAAKRFIVEDRVYDEFLSRFVEKAAALVVGDPMEERTALGPCAREDLRQTIHQQVLGTVSAGGQLATGGKFVQRRGFFYEPTVVAGVEPGMAMFEEEVFGPAAAVIRATDPQRAISLANDSRFGLGANIWSRDVALAEQLAARIEAGSVFINGMVASDPRLPFGGVKKSGYGRELSAFGIREFVNVQTVWIGP
ncbi:MAG TPA: NAD-dependent succinate-semialdehyde dehydrogenase [Candidatus Cybelea sp.]